MSILCSAQNMTVLENLIVRLQAHSLALDLLILERDDLTWTNILAFALYPAGCPAADRQGVLRPGKRVAGRL